jgi:ABC-type Mn2+/Zn2+ transport system ATPase subunit
MLEVRNPQIQRDGRSVLSVDTLTVDQGEVLAVIGPNGASKSTLVLAVSGLLSLQQGEISLHG